MLQRRSVAVRVDADPQRDFSGVVEQIARTAEFTPRNVQTVGERIKQVFGVKVRLDNQAGKLRAGVPGVSRISLIRPETFIEI